MKTAETASTILPRLGLLVALVAVMLFLTGSECNQNTDTDYSRAQAMLQSKIDLRKAQQQPNSVLVDVPAGMEFNDFRPPSEGDEAGVSAQVGSHPLIGIYTYDADYDDQPESVYSIFGRTPEHAFIDMNGDGQYQPNADFGLSFLSEEGTIAISNPEGGEIAQPGSYSTILFRRLVRSADSDALAHTFRTRIYWDSPGGGQEIVETAKFWAPGTQVLPHVPSGPAGDYLLTSQIVLNNPNPFDSTVRLRFLDSASGEPLEVKIGDSSASEHTVAVPARTSRMLDLVPEEGLLKLGWALVHGAPAVEAAVNYVTYRQGQNPSVFAEAGIAAAPTHGQHVLNVVQGLDGVGTAFAIVNPTDRDAVVRVNLTRPRSTAAGGEPGTEVAFFQTSSTAGDELVDTRQLEIPKHQQRALFFTELFNLQDGDFVGTLVFDSDTDIAITSLKTIEGFQSSSLPSGSFTLGRSR